MYQLHVVLKKSALKTIYINMKHGFKLCFYKFKLTLKTKVKMLRTVYAEGQIWIKIYKFKTFSFTLIPFDLNFVIKTWIWPWESSS